MFLLAAVFPVAGSFYRNPWLHDLFTPLGTSLLLTLALFNWLVFKKNYALWIGIGLFFSLLGDIALLRPAQYFLPGLIAFLFAQLAYLIGIYSRHDRPVPCAAALRLVAASRIF
jgi:uncharacterized membrane protein YhhN